MGENRGKTKGKRGGKRTKSLKALRQVKLLHSYQRPNVLCITKVQERRILFHT